MPVRLKVNDSAHRGIDPQAAAAPAPLNPTEPKDALAEVANALGDQADLLPGLVEVSK